MIWYLWVLIIIGILVIFFFWLGNSVKPNY